MQRITISLLTGLLLSVGTVAQPDGGEVFPYQVPAPELAALVDAPPLPSVSISPDRAWLLLMERRALPGLVELAQPEVGLAGAQINPATNGPSRAQAFSGLVLVASDGSGAERTISGLPDDARIRNVSWSPDAQALAFTLEFEDEIGLYRADVASGEARRLIAHAVNDVAGRPYTWLPDGSLVVRAIPEDRGSAPDAPLTPAGPTVQETGDEAAPARTFQNLLENPHDEALFEYFFESELLRVSIDGSTTPLGIRGLLRSVNRSPDGRYLLVRQTLRPFSYLVPWSRFPNRVTVHDAQTGDLIETVADLPLAENVPIGFGSVPTGPRNFSWRANAPATLVWVEALDDGDIRREADARDRVFLHEAPFGGDPRALMDTALRFAGISWSDTGEAFVHEFLFETRTRRSFGIDPDDPDVEPTLIFDISTEDRYNDPGSPVTRSDASGYSLVLTVDDGRTVFLTGAGASPDGNRPFLRRHDLVTGESEELFRSDAPYYEVPLEMIDDDGRMLLTRRESPTEPPNFFLRDLETGDVTALTAFPHPYPHLREVQREVLEYERADGIPLSAVLYLPPGYEAARDGPLPTLVWAYPREFRSADAAGQRTDSPHQFRSIGHSGPVPFVTRGYAVLQNAAMPIVGEGDEEPNDTFVEQLVMNAEAVIQAGVRRGVVDPARVAVAGHSYGAFMTANLIAHSDLFQAGIARSGAYNRTFTPFGFQLEQRTYWEAPDIYNTMSPFMQAHRINQPLLLIHGESDNNAGTFPIQSERLFNAVRGLGGTARMVMLPHESHGYRARESILHMLWETDRWLQIHLGGTRDEQPGAVSR